MHTITADNGKEFAEHETQSEAVKADVYFAHPYASWERGTNENMPERSDKCPWGANGLIRQYFPKGTRFEEITDEQVKAVQEKLNRRSRKILGFKTSVALGKADVS